MLSYISCENTQKSSSFDMNVFSFIFYSIKRHQWWCHCLYDMPNSELEVFPYTHKPAAFRSDFHDGTGEISQTVAPYTYGSAPYTATCFKYTPASATRIKNMGATQGDVYIFERNKFSSNFKSEMHIAFKIKHTSNR